MQADLFRSAAIEANADRLHGEIVLQQPLSTIVTTCVLLAIVVSAAVWVTVGTFARTEIAKGILASEAGSSRVFAIRPGVVTALTVREGDMVEAGQRLAVASTENPSGSGSRATNETLASLANQEGIAVRQLDIVRRTTAAEAARLADALSGFHIQERELRNQVVLQEEAVTSTERTFAQLGTVVDRGFVSRLEYERRRQTGLSARQELSRLRQQLTSTRSDIVRTDEERRRAVLNGESSEMAAKSSLETLRQQRARAEGEAGYIVEAPMSGRVTAIQTGVGRTVSGAVPLMLVMPRHGRLKADLFVPSRAIGFVRPGQEVRLLYDAFPYQRFGSFTAHVETITRNVIAAAEVDAPFKVEEPVYRITASLGSEQVAAYGRPITLQPGMTLTANIVLERQSFLDWLLDPIHAVARRT